MIPWERSFVLEYLDTTIRLWRKVLRKAAPATPDVHEAACHIDAYQQVRVSLFGSPLPEEFTDDRSPGRRD